ncbi:GNAT family N-acetyltransferase [Paenibacillus monticola]|uniref:GNAT family N-acetyltransferase n=1 Tax=Paenibacillus monticola TaxID=2666075 RepID=UPI00189EA324|nr:hypothetical protein [Paenibacillus monticola]
MQYPYSSKLPIHSISGGEECGSEWNGPRNHWTCCLKDGKLIGDVGIHFMADDYQAEIGFTLSPEFQGKAILSKVIG